MDKQRNGDRGHRIRGIASILGVIVMAMVVEILILATINKMNAGNTSEVLLDQVISILEDNDHSETELVETLKEDYVIRARTVSYILDAKPEAIDDVQELQKIANLMRIDEIHIFNEEGVIVSGSLPKYYGYSFDSGEQMAYFKPMLNDKSLTMCQDVTPNTAEAKSMMYAITWNDAGDRMIQVGIEPMRLLEEIRRNEIPEVVSNMPAYEGFNIFVANIETGEVYGATDESLIGSTLDELDIPKSDADAGETLNDTLILGGYKNYCKFRSTGDYIVAVTYSASANKVYTIVALAIEFIYLLLAAFVIINMFKRIIAANEDRDAQLAILTSMSEVYYSMHLIDLPNDAVTEYTADEIVKKYVNRRTGATLMMQNVMRERTDKKYVDIMLEFTDLTTVSGRMKDRKIISQEFLGKGKCWYRASFIMIDKDEFGHPAKVFFVTRDIDHDKRKEMDLLMRSNTDQLTGLYNRRAYEDDMDVYNAIFMGINETAVEGLSGVDEAAVYAFSDATDGNHGQMGMGVMLPDGVSIPAGMTMDDFVFVSLDVNGLKTVNDNMGHAAGDELLMGAVECIRECFGGYGKLYRVGGDEFAAVIFADAIGLEQIRDEFLRAASSWSGSLVKFLAVSVGYVTRREAEGKSVYEMAKLADKRMYQMKEEYYRKNGLVRRKQ